MRPLFGTFVEVGVYPDEEAGRAITAAFAVLQRVQDALSFQDPGSELSGIHRRPGKAISVSPLMRNILRLSQRMCQASHGLFNHTVAGALVQQGRLPDHEARDLVAVGTSEDIELHDHTLRLHRPIRITFDGIAKGYGVDLAIGELRRHGICAGWVNAGGDIRAFGPVSLPVARRDVDGTLQPLGYLRDAAIATSRAASVDDESYPGFIVGEAGAKVDSGLWSVVARRAWRADALTKVAATAPPALQRDLVARLGGRLMSAQPLQ